MNINKSIFVGKVQGTPDVTQQGDNKQATFILVVSNRVQTANGQWVDSPSEVPVFAKGKRAGLIEQYVVAGQELGVEARFTSWRDEQGQLQVAFELMDLSYGYKPKVINK
jgi:single-stranded DNA-binding protein